MNRILNRKKLVIYLLLIGAMIGSQPCAAQVWKTEATQRIDTLRKSTISLSLTGIPDSEALPKVRVRQLQSDFVWGTVVNIGEVSQLVAQGFPIGSDHPYYNHLRNFNSITPENAGKWKGWLNEDSRQTYAEVRAWLKALGIASRGHTTIWESNKFSAIPDIVKEAKDADEMRALIKSHIEDQLGELKDDVYELELVNEPAHETDIVSDLMKVDPATERALWHQWARAAAPDLPLIINEFDLIQSGNNFYEDFISYVNDFTAAGGIVDGIGMQGHFFEAVPIASSLQERIDQVRVLNLPMRVTEFDMETNTYDEMERILYVCYADSIMTGFTLWGAWDGQQWRGNGAIYNEDWSMKASGKAYFDLVHKLWKTDSTFSYDEASEFKAFKGTYELIIEHEGKTEIVPFELGDDPLDLTVDIADLQNQTPTIQLNEPAEELCQGEFVSIAATASDPNGAIEKIELYINDQYHGTSQSGNLNIEWEGPAGNHSLYAVAYDDEGAYASSDTYEVTIVPNTIEESWSVVFPPSGIGVKPGQAVSLHFDYDNVDQVNVVGVFDDNLQELASSPQPVDQLSFSSKESPGVHTAQIITAGGFGCESTEFFSYTVIDDETSISIVVSTELPEDDVEHLGSSTISGDLDMGEKDTWLYFRNANIPHGATIEEAYIQFASDKSGQVDDLSLDIHGEVGTKPKTLDKGGFGARSLTDASVSWTVPAWEVAHEAGSDQRTPDLTDVLQEVVDHQGHAMTYPLVFKISNATSGGKRSAVAYDQISKYAPSLTVKYTMDLPDQPKAPSGLQIIHSTSGPFGLKWNPVLSDNIIGYEVYVGGPIYTSLPIQDTTIDLDVDLPIAIGGGLTMGVLAVDAFMQKSDQTQIDYLTDVDDIESFSLYPNPVRDVLQLNGERQFKRLKIYNAMGHECMTVSHLANAVNVERLQPGIYLLVFETNYGNSFQTKIIKQ